MEERAMEPAEVSSGFMVGLLFGAAVGAAMGLLFAPKSGRQMRRDLTKTARLARRRATDMYDDASDGFQSMVDSGREAFETVASKIDAAKAAVEHHRRA